MSEPLINALRALRVADPDLGLKPLLANNALGVAVAMLITFFKRMKRA